MNGAVRIEIVGIPFEDGRVLWVQDVDKFGGKTGVVANEEFAGVILSRMESARRMELLKEQAIKAAKGIQGI